jgi:hypothetical protein
VFFVNNNQMQRYIKNSCGQNVSYNPFLSLSYLKAYGYCNYKNSDILKYFFYFRYLDILEFLYCGTKSSVVSEYTQVKVIGGIKCKITLDILRFLFFM